MTDPLCLVLDALERLGIPYAIGGSLASSIHGDPRATRDVDMVARVEPRHAPALVEALSGTFYVAEAMILEAIAHRSSFNVIHRTAFKIDIFVLGNREWDRVSFERRRLTAYPGQPGRQVFVRSAEDIVLKKLEWFRLGGEVSERQWSDVLGVLRVQGSQLDDAYLRRWAAALGVADLLTEALEEAGFP